MRPLIVYFDEKDENITLTKKEFEQYMANAYDQGYEDGAKTTQIQWSPNTTNPYPLNSLVNTFCDTETIK